MRIVVHTHVHDSFEESKHPRGSHGQFGKGTLSKREVEAIENIARAQPAQQAAEARSEALRKQNAGLFKLKEVPEPATEQLEGEDILRIPGAAHAAFPVGKSKAGKWQTFHVESREPGPQLKATEVSGWLKTMHRNTLDALTTDKGPFKESEHPRASNGEFGTGAKGKAVTMKVSKSSLKPVKARVFTGQPIETETKLSKQETGALGERIAMDWLRNNLHKDARAVNSKIPNFPVDLVAGDHLVEVKTGMVSNGKAAQQWRATIGQPGKAETEWLKTASPEDKAAWNQTKMKAILDRKNKALKDYQKETGKKVKAKTLTLIVNPDTKTADVFVFDGFHLRVAWNSPEAKAAHVGTFKYE